MQTISERLGCSTITFRHQALFEALDNIVSTGLKKVDIACIPGFCPHINPLEITQPEVGELRKRLSDLGMTVSTLNVSAGGLNTEKREFVFQFIEAAIEIAAQLGCYAITIPSGSKVSDASLWEQNARISIQAIQELAGCATEKGIHLTLEAPHTGTLAESVAEARRFFELLGDVRVGCTFDTSHVARANPVPVPECIPQVGAPIGHVHLRDCIEENNHLTPGKGEVDFQGVLDTLKEAGYTRDLILELEGEDSKLAAGELAFAINYIEGLRA